MIETDVAVLWEEIRILVESMDIDVRKSAQGNSSAGIRARKGLRLLKIKSAELVKASISSRPKLSSKKKTVK